MNWSIPIGAVKGTVIRVHLTFFLFLLWIGGVHYAQGGRQAALEGVAFIVLLFLCVLLHEFGHVFAARRYGVQTPDITLLPIGGVARLERIPEQPGQELVVALAGPAVNVVIAAALYAVLGGFVPAQAVEVHNAGVGVLQRLAAANLFLVLFNLIPAFPMDGGRVLRAALAYRMGYTRATRIAATVGQGVAFLLGVAGLFGNPLLLFIAVFVYLGAAGESHDVQMREASRGLPADAAAVTQFESLSPLASVDDAVKALLRTTQHEFPVVDGAGRLRGVLTREGIIQALRERGPETPVMEAMHADIPIVGYRQSLDGVLRLLRESRAPAVGVTDGTGRLIGLVTPENVGELMMVLAARPGRGGTAAPQPPGRVASPWG